MKADNEDRKKTEIHSTRVAYKGRIFSFVTEDVTLPNGSRSEMAYVRHPGSTAIVPLVDDNTVIMERQYRHPVRDYLFEIPAGTMDPGETVLACARRELEEETGYTADEFIELGITHILPAYSDEVIHVYLARCLSLSEQRLDPDEIINVVKYPLDEALKMIETGQITDALTILALQRTWFHIKGRG
jgi:ADP-ribose pyrophosphatase